LQPEECLRIKTFDAGNPNSSGGLRATEKDSLPEINKSFFQKGGLVWNIDMRLSPFAYADFPLAAQRRPKILQRRYLSRSH